jgi:hypothetical protein
MRKMPRLFVPAALVSIALSTCAFAQIDPDPDGIGIYADLAATCNNLTIGAFTEFEVYLIATNITETDIVTWGLGIDWTPGLMITGHTYPYTLVGNHIFSLSVNSLVMAVSSQGFTILTYGPDAHLVTLRFISLTAGTDSIYLGPFHWNSTYETAITYNSERTWNSIPEPSIVLHPSSGAFTAPVFVVNEDAPVANEDMTIGQVKRLYR